jgi:hypothetical protein
MNKKLVLGFAGTLLFVLAFLMGKATAARAQSDDEHHHVGRYWYVQPSSGLTLNATEDSNGIICYSLGASALSCVRP